MADRIVQLEDNEGNKIYPISAFDESAVLIDTTSPESTPFDVSTMGSYSLEEIETPFTWIDGKKIYKKTFQNYFASAGDNIITTFSGWRIVKVEGFIEAINSGVNRMVPTFYNVSSPACNSFYAWDGDDLTFKAQTGFGEYNLYTTIWYTKS